MKKLLPEEYISGIMLCGMVLLVVVQVVSRYFFHSSLSFTEEIVRYLFVWITFIGAAAAVHHGGHFSVAGLVHRFPVRIRRAAGVFRFAGAIVFAGLLVFYGIRVVSLQYRTGQTTAALSMPMWMVGLVIPCCAILLIIRLMTSFLGERGEE